MAGCRGGQRPGRFLSAGRRPAPQLQPARADPGVRQPAGTATAYLQGNSYLAGRHDARLAPVIKLHEGGRHTGNSLMRDAGVDQEVRMREVGHAGRDINDRYTHVLIEAHLVAAKQTAALVREAGKTAQ